MELREVSLTALLYQAHDAQQERLPHLRACDRGAHTDQAHPARPDDQAGDRLAQQLPPTLQRQVGRPEHHVSTYIIISL